MKRYRITTFFIDTTRNWFKLAAENKNVDSAIVAEQAQRLIVPQFGDRNFEQKYKRFMELEMPSLTVVGEYRLLLDDISNCYVFGSLYSALTGACCLGERIFNDVILIIRDDYKSSPWYKTIYRSGSIIDWEKAITILKDWGIIDDETEVKYLRLAKLRNDSIHYQPKTQDVAAMALEALNLVNAIVEKLFSSWRSDILLVGSEVYIKKEAEHLPLVKAFYIPCASYVGYKYRIDAGNSPQGVIIDDSIYEDREITDEEFLRLRANFISP